jgi:aspartyl-tRNA(Asn)/glutamyl-tRNA(Gln) amidotransferase subunit A
MSLSLPKFPTINDVHDLYKNGQTKVSEVVEYFYNRVLELDKSIDGVVRYNLDLARSQAVDMDKLMIDSDIDSIIQEKPLFGIPYLLKDNVLVQGQIVTAQSKILDGYEAVYSADIYEYLTQAGAVLLGQTNMDEFAFGSSTEFSGFGQVTKNPFDNTRVAGGTSGGSAALVGAGAVVFAIGTDTGGSIRQPSGFCGTVGIRPTYGSVSRYGIIASTSSFDQAGPITNNILDNQKILAVLQKQSNNDQTSINLASKNHEPELKIGFLDGLDESAVDSNIWDLFSNLETTLSQKYNVKKISLPTLQYSLAVYYILQTVEAAANLERFDGLRYGQNSPDLPAYFGARGQLFGDEVKRRVMLGTYTSAAGYYDAYYNKACKARELISQDFAKAFLDVDVLIMPVSPILPFKIGENSHNPLSMYLSDIMTVSQPISKLPALVIPGGSVEKKDKELPIGIQIVADQGGESNLYFAASIISNIDN